MPTDLQQWGPRFDAENRCTRHGEAACPSCLVYALTDARMEVERLTTHEPRPLRLCPGCGVPFTLDERHSCPGYSWAPGEVEKLRDLLREVEWQGANVGDEDCCPICREPAGFGKPGRHAADCRLAAALGVT